MPSNSGPILCRGDFCMFTAFQLVTACAVDCGINRVDSGRWQVDSWQLRLPLGMPSALCGRKPVVVPRSSASVKSTSVDHEMILSACFVPKFR
jgi:hypothetical protein